MSKVYVKTSAQHGRGVFAAADIAADEEILLFTGPRLHRSALNPHDYHLQIADELYLGPSGLADDYVNHCCAPNAAIGAGLVLRALRAIARDEEITWDYSTAIDEEDFPGFPCCCGAPNCRKIVTSFRRLSPADQQRLAPYALPYLQAKLKIAAPA
ncbi:MAG: SET domain-containing protein-lysine N-methyltransferase [Pseudomonadota bacterium]